MARYDFFTVLEDIDNREIEARLRQNSLDPYSFLTLMHGRDCREVRNTEMDDRCREERGGLAKATHRRIVHVRGHAQTSRYSRQLISDKGKALDLTKELGLDGIRIKALELLPEFAVALKFRFRLEKDYISRDDARFYPTANPIRKDWVFKVPMVSGATWKGSLRAAAVDKLLDGKPSMDERLNLIALFGHEKTAENDEDANDSLHAYLNSWFDGQGPPDAPEREGRVRCLPSYFDRIELQVINPRSRRTRAGTQPIEMEVAPAGAEATFSMLYLPFDLLGRPRGEIVEAVRQDWKLLGQALVRMFRSSGFGAKKSSGCGKACDELVSPVQFIGLAPELKPKEHTRIADLANLHCDFEVTHVA